MKNVKNKIRKYSGGVIIGSLLFAACVQANEKSESTHITPYASEVDYQIDPESLRDLQAGLERAKTVLKRVQEEAAQLGGEVLYEHLDAGMKEALAQSSLRSDLLLFRIVLLRAQELDRLIQESMKGPLGKELSAKLILRPSIDAALQYYVGQDAANTRSTQISIPDWKKFGESQIPFLLRVTDLAPSNRVKTEFMKRALGWTARALLSSSETRRSMAEKIAELENALHVLQAGPTERAVLIGRKLLSQLGMPLQSVVVGDRSKFLEANGHKGRGDSVFPLFGNIGKPLEEFNRSDDWMSQDLQIEAGALRSSQGNGTVTANPAVRGKYALLYGFKEGMTSGKREWSPMIYYGILEVGGGAEINSIANKVSPQIKSYQGKVDASMGAILGAFVTVEANRFAEFSETMVRGGFSLVGAFGKDEHSFFIVQLRGGGSNFENGIQAVTPEGKVIESGVKADGSEASRSSTPNFWEVLAKAKLKGFILEAGIDSIHEIERVDTEDHTAAKVREWKRNSLKGSIQIPFPLFIGNSAIKVEGKVVEYQANERFENTAKNRTAEVTHSELGAYYVLTW